MYYEINVAFKGHHVFATAERSLTTMRHAEWVFVELQKRFPAADGYEVTICRVNTTIETVTHEEIKRG